MSHLHKADGPGIPKVRGTERVMSSIFQAGLLKSRYSVPSYVKYFGNPLISGVLGLCGVMSSFSGVMSSFLKGSDSVGAKRKTPLPQSS